MGRKIRMGFVLLLLLALGGPFATGYSGAYFSHQGDMEPTEFLSAQTKIDFAGGPRIDVVSDYSTHQGASWAITNIGDNSIYLRVRPGEEVEGRDCGCDDGARVRVSVVDADWQLGEDGYFYYYGIIDPGQTVVFHLAVEFEGWSPLDLPLEMEAEAVQESNDARAQVWPACPYN